MTRTGADQRRDGSARVLVTSRTFQVVAAVYLAGLVVWLLLGLLPSLSGPGGPLHSAAGHLASGDGRLATYASRVVTAPMATASAGWVALNYLFSVVNLALGVVLVVKRPDEPVARLLALAVMGTAATFNEPSHEVFHLLGSPPAVQAVHFTFHVVSGTAYLWAVTLFPDGALPVTRGGGRSLRLLATVGTVVIVLVCWRSSFIAHPPFFVAFFGVLVPVVGITAQSAKLRATAARLPRVAEQSRLLRTALLPALGAAMAWATGHLLILTGTGGDAGPRIVASVQVGFPAVFAVVPVVMFVAIVRYGLWDIDVVVSRTLLVAVLLTCVTLVYVAAVIVTGLLVSDRGWVVVVPLVAVACVAEPIRQRCQAWCNRLVFGQALTPREAVRSLVDGFAGLGESDELSELTRVVVQSSRASGAALWLSGPLELALLARHPADPSAPTSHPVDGNRPGAVEDVLAPATCWPVSYQGEPLAVLAVTTPRGVTLTRRERRLLEELTDHAGLLVANARLTVDLARELDVVRARAAELQRSRRDVVAAQDRRRRRLERDIHDGAQQELVALLIMLRTLARRSTRANPSAAAVDTLRRTLVTSAQTLSRLSSGQAPLVLARDGLAAALRDAAATVDAAGPQVRVRVSALPRLAPEEQAAVYFCCLEALQNAVKHAAASHIDVVVGPCPEGVSLTVTDDGRGFDQGTASEGTGLAELGSRLLVLGGDVEVHSAPGRGTTVRGRLPLSAPGRVPRPRDRPVGAPT